jgi:hypothetical protein
LLDAPLRRASESRPKISDTLVAFAAPLLHLPPDTPLATVETLLRFAMILWNAANSPDLQHASDLDDFIEDHVQVVSLPDTIAQGRQLAHAMLERKRTLFAGDDRFIFDLQVSAAPDGFRLTVSTFAGELPARP